MSPPPACGPRGLWAGWLDRLPAPDAVRAAQAVEAAGVDAVWLPEFSGIDPFVRAALYLSATERLTVAFGVANVYARDPEAMVAASSTLQEAFPGRVVLGLGVSHRRLVEARGHLFGPPLATMSGYLDAMEAAVRDRVLPPRLLGGLGPKMMALAGSRVEGVHTYFCPLGHTAQARAAVGTHGWVAPSQMVAAGSAHEVRDYLQLCLGLPSYTDNLLRHGLSERDVAETSPALVDALVVAGDAASVSARVAAQQDAGADHVVLQLVPPPPAERVLAWLQA